MEDELIYGDVLDDHDLVTWQVLLKLLELLVFENYLNWNPVQMLILSRPLR